MDPAVGVESVAAEETRGTSRSDRVLLELEAHLSTLTRTTGTRPTRPGEKGKMGDSNVQASHYRVHCQTAVQVRKLSQQRELPCSRWWPTRAEIAG